MTNPNTITFAFSVGEDVLIKPLELTGRVLARCDRGLDYHDYRVIFWADSKRHDEYMYEFELEKIND